jgi:hypothetical protein
VGWLGAQFRRLLHLQTTFRHIPSTNFNYVAFQQQSAHNEQTGMVQLGKPPESGKKRNDHRMIQRSMQMLVYTDKISINSGFLEYFK